jgi:hypothetical protein
MFSSLERADGLLVPFRNERATLVQKYSAEWQEGQFRLLEIPQLLEALATQMNYERTSIPSLRRAALDLSATPNQTMFVEKQIEFEPDIVSYDIRTTTGKDRKVGDKRINHSGVILTTRLALPEVLHSPDALMANDIPLVLARPSYTRAGVVYICIPNAWELQAQGSLKSIIAGFLITRDESRMNYTSVGTRSKAALIGE